MPTGEPWKIALVTSVLLVPDMRAKGYSRADFHAPVVPINEVKSQKTQDHALNGLEYISRVDA